PVPVRVPGEQPVAQGQRGEPGPELVPQVVRERKRPADDHPGDDPGRERRDDVLGPESAEGLPQRPNRTTPMCSNVGAYGVTRTWRGPLRADSASMRCSQSRPNGWCPGDHTYQTVPAPARRTTSSANRPGSARWMRSA